MFPALKFVNTCRTDSVPFWIAPQSVSLGDGRRCDDDHMK